MYTSHLKLWLLFQILHGFITLGMGLSNLCSYCSGKNSLYTETAIGKNVCYPGNSYYVKTLSCGDKNDYCFNLIGLSKCKISVLRGCASAKFCEKDLKGVDSDECNYGILQNGKSCYQCCQGDICNTNMLHYDLVKRCNVMSRGSCFSKKNACGESGVIREHRMCELCNGKKIERVNYKPCSIQCRSTTTTQKETNTGTTKINSTSSVPISTTSDTTTSVPTIRTSTSTLTPVSVIASKLTICTSNATKTTPIAVTIVPVTARTAPTTLAATTKKITITPTMTKATATVLPRKTTSDGISAKECIDNKADCASITFLCKNLAFIQSMKTACAATCGFCNRFTVNPLTTKTTTSTKTIATTKLKTAISKPTTTTTTPTTATRISITTATIPNTTTISNATTTIPTTTTTMPPTTITKATTNTTTTMQTTTTTIPTTSTTTPITMATNTTVMPTISTTAIAATTARREMFSCYKFDGDSNTQELIECADVEVFCEVRYTKDFLKVIGKSCVSRTTCQQKMCNKDYSICCNASKCNKEHSPPIETWFYGDSC